MFAYAKLLTQQGKIFVEVLIPQHQVDVIEWIYIAWGKSQEIAVRLDRLLDEGFKGFMGPIYRSAMRGKEEGYATIPRVANACRLEIPRKTLRIQLSLIV
jgi:hypothetical protein